MKYLKLIFMVVFGCSFYPFIPATAQAQSWMPRDQKLKKGWQIHSAEKVPASGKVISSASYQPQKWYTAEVPTTVLAALVKDGVYKNIYFNRNLTHIKPYRFNVPWWYRTTFTIPQKNSGQNYRLRFNGISYRADVWLNGQKIASSDTLCGSFRRFTLNIGKYTKAGKNVLAVKVTRPYPGDPTIGFVDWNPEPADHDMGIWRSVHLLTSGPVSIDEPYVKTKLDTATLKHADLTISAYVHNYSDQTIQGTLNGSIGSKIQISKKVSLAPHQIKKVAFTPDEYSQLGMNHPHLWWTHELGDPYLYHLHLHFNIGNRISDKKSVQFGVRSVSEYFTKAGFKGFRLNGKKVLIKGGGWTDPMLLNASSDYEKAGIDYAVQMNLNAIRMEGFWGENQHLYNLCDEKGILIQVGISCQWEWPEHIGTPADKHSGLILPEQQFIAAQTFKDEVIWLRNHPSIFVWMYGSDKWPRPSQEKKYLAILKKYDPTRPSLASAAEWTSKITGPTAVKMRGPYDYVPPDYWYVDTHNGGAFGYNTETSPGVEVPVLESLKKMIPADSLWPISSSWLFHAARYNFHNLTHYNQAMNKRLGKPADLNDYERKAQYLNYEGMRAMYEAFEANRYKATGIIQWMYNASWPKLWWQLYDFYLMPTGAFYGARKANEPVHISYNYGKNSIDIMNNTLNRRRHLSAEVQVLDFNLKPVVKKMIKIRNLPSRYTLQAYNISPNLSLSKTYFVDLKLRNRHHKVISSNFYVLSTQKDKIDPSKATWYITPQTQFANLKELQSLPMVNLSVQKHFVQRGDDTYANVTIKNPSSHLAFMVHLDFKNSQTGHSVTPIFWNDNYITLLPGEQRTISGYCHTKDLNGTNPQVTISGWNIK
ncbi:MAG TPA: glycoside hydrolase family 2 TIM barrel-domain containing protein [Balneolales bacterium]|nr:glycoside hydrolase family 2 TIM barrel-domain containing protein [Balneolales bacterium]